MRKILRFCPHLIACLLSVTLLTACGSDNKTTIVSNPLAVIFYSHTVAFKNGILYTWGANNLGQLGNNVTTGATVAIPQAIVFPPNFSNIAGASAGGDHTLAFSNTGTVWAWGNNAYGQLGNFTSTISFLPIEVVTLTGKGITAVAAGGNHSLALDQSGLVWAWGDNANGQLGTNITNANSLFPLNVVFPATATPGSVTKIAAGGGHSLAISDANNTAYAWGYNAYGQLGQASGTNNLFMPSMVVHEGGGTLTNVRDIAAGGSHSLFVDNNGAVWACGYNTWGQVGDGTLTNRANGVVQVQGLPTNATVTAIAAGLTHSLALMSDGTVWGWGMNYFGQLGYGAPLSSIQPIEVPHEVMIDANNALSNITKIIAIGNSSFALDINGQLWAWGENTNGQLGLGDLRNRNFAGPIPSMASGADLYHP